VWNYKNLDIWKMSHRLVKDVYEVLEILPKKEDYNLISQLRRASFSVPCNIVEGSGKRTYKDFASYLDNAMGSLKEVEYQIFASWDFGYINEGKYLKLKNKITALSIKLNAYTKYIKDKDVK